MKALIIPLLILLASCGSTHKVVTSKKTTLDSSSTLVRDTAHVSRETSSSDNLNVQNVHIRVEYAADTALAKAKEQPAGEVGDGPSTNTPYGAFSLQQTTTGNQSGPWGYGANKPLNPSSNAAKIAQAIKGAIAAGGGAGRLPSSITVDIGSISDSSTQKAKSDSAGSHSSDDKHLKQTEDDNAKNVTHWSLPWWAWAIIIIIILGGAYKAARYFKIF